MADRMEFPKTIQKFMDGYSFKDDKEIYTNGTRIIPTFRVEQAFEYYGQEVRNKAIDDFAEEISEKAFENSFKITMTDGNGVTYPVDVVTLDYISEMVFDIAEQLERSGKDE